MLVVALFTGEFVPQGPGGGRGCRTVEPTASPSRDSRAPPPARLADTCPGGCDTVLGPVDAHRQSQLRAPAHAQLLGRESGEGGGRLSRQVAALIEE